MPSIYLNGIKYGGVGATGANGKNVVVAKVEPIIGGNKVTFLYYDDNNVSKTSFIEVMNGEQGTSIASARIEDGNELILKLTNDTEISAGKIVIDSSNLNLDNYYDKLTIDELFEKQEEKLKKYVDDKFDETLGMVTSDDITNLF